MLVLVLLAAELPSWMAGSWQATVDGTRMEEHWSSAAGTMMVGMHRDVRPNGRTLFEFMRIEKKDDTLVFQAMPNGQPPTPFPAKEIAADRITFENPDHDFPQRIIYWKSGGQLCARVEGAMNGKAASEQWCWNRF